LQKHSLCRMHESIVFLDRKYLRFMHTEKRMIKFISISNVSVLPNI